MERVCDIDISDEEKGEGGAEEGGRTDEECAIELLIRAFLELAHALHDP